MSERWSLFNIEHDNELIAAGTHFWCSACLVAKPLDDISPDQRYCQGCYEFLYQEAKILPKNKRPGWIPKKAAAASDRKPSASTQDNQELVSKIIPRDIPPVNNYETPKKRILKQPGRPKKTGELSRTTTWRREKEKQGVLV